MKWLFLLLFPFLAQAEASRPAVPGDWVEAKSEGPVILTWVLPDPSIKNILDLPSFSIQKFPREDKLVSFIENKSPDKNSCAHLKAEKKDEWFQVWCLRPKSVVVMMWKNTLKHDDIKANLLKWVLTHE